jgi:hypothetical protein
VPPVKGGALAIGILTVEREAPCPAIEQFLYREGHKPDFSSRCKNSRRQASSGPRLLMINTDHFERDGANRLIILLLTPVRSEADSREWCNSADVNIFFPKRWELVSCLSPSW